MTSQRILLVDVPQYGFWKLLVLHLAPGALSTLVYLALTALAARLHLPMLSALLIASVVALVPLEIGHLLLQGNLFAHRDWSLENQEPSGGNLYAHSAEPCWRHFDFDSGTSPGMRRCHLVSLLQTPMAVASDVPVNESCHLALRPACSRKRLAVS